MTKITCLHFLLLCGVSGVGSWKPRFWSLEVSVIQGTHTYPEGGMGISGFAYCLWARILYVSITDFTKLFWSGDAYFGKQNGTYISSLDFSIPQSLVQILESGIVLRLSVVWIVQG